MNHQAFPANVYQPANSLCFKLMMCGWSGCSVFSKKYQEQKSSSSLLEKKRKNACPWPGSCNFRNSEELFCSSQITSMQKLSRKRPTLFLPAINKTLACAKTSDLREGMLEYCFSASIHKRMVSGTPLRQFLPMDLSFSRFSGGQRAFWV